MQLLSNVVQYCYHRPPLENPIFSTTVHPVDLRPVCKFDFVRCGPVEKNRALYLSRFDHGSPTKFEDTFFKKIIFLHFRQNAQFLKKFSGDEFKS